MRHFILLTTVLLWVTGCTNDNGTRFTPTPVEDFSSQQSSESQRNTESLIFETTIKTTLSTSQELPSSEPQILVITQQPLPEKADPKVLIIVVVDTSNSMKRWLRNSKYPFDDFPKTLSPLDWTAIFTKADSQGFLSSKGRAMRLEHDGHLLLDRQLTKDMKDYESIFIDTLRLHGFNEYFGGHDGASTQECDLSPGCQWGRNEKPLKSLKATLIANRSSIESADIVVAIVISDSDEGRHSDSTDKVHASEVKNLFETEYSTKQLITYGIIMTPDDPGCLEQWHWTSEKVYGERIAQMALETGGANFSLCEPSYVPLAEKIVSDIQNIW